MMPAARSSAGMTMPPAAGKKPRKPYKITRPREKWTVDEHDRFLHALLLFGRDWKRIEQFVTTKTATQIRSHAQKYFLKAQKLGLAAALPPPQPRRAAVLAADAPCGGYPDGNNAVAGVAMAMAPPTWPTTAAATPPMSCADFAAPPGGAQQSQSADWGRAATGGAHHYWPSCGGEPGGASWAAGAMAQEEDETVRLPLSPDDPRFALVYRFVGDVFVSGEARPVDALLQRLHGVDPAVVDTIWLVLRNLEGNLLYLLRN